MQKKQLSVLVLIILCFLLGCNRETPKDESQQNYEDESNISKTNGEELVNINSELLGSTPFDIQIDKTALQTRKETETEVTIKTNLTDWGYTVSSEKGKISDINKNSFIYIAPKDERDDTIKIQTSVYKGYKRDKIEMRGDRAEISDFPLYLNTVAGGLDCRDQTIGGFSFVVKIYAVPVVEIIG